MPTIVVCGTLAIDLIGRYPGEFAGADGGLSLRLGSFEQRFGGCAMNIAWNLALLGARAVPLARAGRDFHDGYAAHLERQGIDLRGVYVDPGVAHCSRCILLEDRRGHQITAWFSGPASDAWSGAEYRADDLVAASGARFAIVAPDHPRHMLRHLDALRTARVPVLTDPGQGIGDFSSAETRALIAASSSLVLNANECDIVARQLGIEPLRLARRLDCLVVTHGADGVDIWRGERRVRVPAVPATPVDSTGAGDAFRAAWAWGLCQGIGDVDAARLGATLAAFAVEAVGPQSHKPSRADIARRYQHTYRSPCPPGLAGEPK